MRKSNVLQLHRIRIFYNLTDIFVTCRRSSMMSVGQLRVTIGEHDLQAAELPEAISKTIKYMTVHPDFECGRWNNDIALLELSTPIQWSASVRPVCLPPETGRIGYSVFSGTSAIVAGWGWLGEDKSVCEYARRY